MNESIQLSRTSVTPGRDEKVALSGNGNDAAPSVIAHSAYGYDQDEDQAVHLRDYWRIIRKHLWLIIGMTVLIPTLVAIYLVRKPDVYEAQARIQVDLENTNPLLGGMSKNSSVIVNSETNDPAYFNTQLQILTGPGLLRRVAKTLDLEHNSDFLGEHSGGNTSVWTSLRVLFGLN